MPARRRAIDCFNDLYAPEPNSGCWLWIGSVDACGYGKFNGRDGETLAHRFSYKHFSCAIGAGLEIDHICKTRSCVNPAHLRAVTHAENVARADYKTNHRNGRKTHCKRGHPLTGANLFIKNSGKGKRTRQCWTCVAARDRRYAKKAIYGVKITEV